MPSGPRVVFLLRGSAEEGAMEVWRLSSTGPELETDAVTVSDVWTDPEGQRRGVTLTFALRSEKEPTSLSVRIGEYDFDALIQAMINVDMQATLYAIKSTLGLDPDL